MAEPDTGPTIDRSLLGNVNSGFRINAIPAARDRMQSALLAGAVGALLAVRAVLLIVEIHREGAMPGWFWGACGVATVFAIVVWLLRAATAPAAAMGGLVCLHVLMRQELGVSWSRTAMPALLALFLLTFGATKFGRARKEAMGIAEGRTGRRASQVLANLGVAGLFAAGGAAGMPAAGTVAAGASLAACIAALAEATADTVSSEIGQALAGTRWAGRTLLITTGKPVPPGTDGGVTIAGTVLGVSAAAIVIMLSPLPHAVIPALCVFAAACVGLFFDSLLGATLERKGWLGNDLVNLSSTAVAATIAFVLARLL